MRWWPFRRREQRTITYQDVWGSGGDIHNIRGDSLDTALSLIPVFAAARLLSDSVATLPMQTFRQSGENRTHVPDPALLRNPSLYGQSYQWVQRALISMILRGNAYGLITARDHVGTPTQIEWLHPDDVGLVDDRTIVRPQWLWMGRSVPLEDFVHIPWFTIPGRINGVSPIGAYKLTIETGLGAVHFGRDWFRNGSVPSGVVQTEQEVDEDTAKIVKRRFKEAVSQRDVAVLGAGLQYKPISVPPEESQFLATIKASKTDIANIYGIPPEMIGGETGTTSLTYANVEQQSINFVVHTLMPYMTRLECAISALLPRPLSVKFNVDAMLRADTATRYNAHHLALTDGWMSKDEVRAVEDMPPLPDGAGQGYAPVMAPPKNLPGGTQ